jgi:UDP-N-acetylmuramoyl-tripeptide--D-alanyl-D-alanine ligase
MWRNMAGTRRCMVFSATPAADPSALTDVACTAAIWQSGAWQVQARTPAGPLQFILHMAGAHNLHNALAAATCALAAGAPLTAIVDGLQAFEPVKGRSRSVALNLAGKHCTLIDDSYNANPDSVDAALAMLASLPAPRLMVLGDMGEVGDQGTLFHAQAGARAHALGIDALFTLGELSAHAAQAFAGARHFANIDELIAAACQDAGGYASMLVKGSRFMQMEKLVDALTHQAPALALAKTTGDATCC